MKIYRFFYLLMLCSGIGSAFSQELLTFDQAIAAAMQNNHQIEIARNNAEIANNKVNVGNADLLPRIDVVSSANYQDNERQTTAGKIDDDFTTSSAVVQASYTLFDGFGNTYRFKKLQAGGKLGELQARDNIERTLLQVSNAYYIAALTFENVHIAEELTAISFERLERAKKRSMFGQANTIDVLAAQVDLNSDSVTVTNARLRWSEARRNLNVLLNRDVNKDFVVASEVSFRNGLNLADMKQQAQNKNASYLSSLNQLEQSKLSYKIARSANSPKVNLNSSYGYSQTSPDFDVNLNDPDRGWNVGATLSFNIFNGFKTKIDKENAKVNIRNQELLKEEAHLLLEKEITNNFESYQNSLLVLRLEKKNLESAELNFKRTQELFNLGQVTTTQFREAQLNLISARNNISSAKYTAKLLEIELMRLSGQLLS